MIRSFGFRAAAVAALLSFALVQTPQPALAQDGAIGGAILGGAAGAAIGGAVTGRAGGAAAGAIIGAATGAALGHRWKCAAAASTGTGEIATGVTGSVTAIRSPAGAAADLTGETSRP
jgi:hypothetical protein